MRKILSGHDVVVAGAVLLGALAGGGGTAPAGEARNRPNVLLITTDQQRVDAMSAVGNAWLKTPHMDAIAANGVYFTRSYCPYPLCSPSRTSLHTGRMPHESRVDHNSLPVAPETPVSGQVFRAAGYDTAYAGKWHMPESYPSDGIPGFEVLNKTTRNRKLAHDVDEATMNAAIEYLQRPHGKPFLLVASFINPHDICLLAGEDSPLFEEVRETYKAPEGAELPPLPANFAPPAGGPDKKARMHEAWDETQWRRYRYAYFRMVEDVDRQVGQLMDALRKAGLEENTLVLFTSDHGEGLGSHRWTGKMMYYEEEAAVPLIVSWKGVTPAGRIDRQHLVSTIDVLPTLCDYAGVPPPPAVRGRSLRGVIEKPDQPGALCVFAEMAAAGMGGTGRSFMARTAAYKYMAFPQPREGRFEMLFDLEADPGEMKNLAGEASFEGELERHRNLLAEWNRTTEEGSYPIQANPVAGQKRSRRQP
jgi:arylsulfatase A-like enzyme